MSEQALRVAVIGCGNISGAYGETMSAYSSVRIAGATDVDRALSEAFVDRFGGVHYPSLGDVLDDPAVDAIVNLTYPGVHAEVTGAAISFDVLAGPRVVWCVGREPSWPICTLRTSTT